MSISKNILVIVSLLCVITTKAQVVPKQAMITSEMEMRNKNGMVRKIVDTFLVRNTFILDPVKVFYSSEETTLNTSNYESTHKLISSGWKLKGYCFTSLKESIGLAFDVEQPPSPETIKAYQFDRDNQKQGVTFINEPYIPGDVLPTDYVKEKDTIINGQQCILVKRTKVIQNTFKGKVLEKVTQFRLAINPKISYYAFPFISEKIPNYFGGGAVVYVDGATDKGTTATIHYSYAEFTEADKKLFNHYQELYKANLNLLNKYRKRY